MEQLGKYQLVRKLATGGMAEVYLAKSAGPRGFEKILVLKRILSHLAQDERFISMFLSEAKLAARLDHPNVVQIFDFGETDGEFYLAMEYIDGPTLRFVMRRAAEERMRLPLAFCAKVASLVCEGLAYAHDFCDPETGQWLGLVHRDVTPENILVSRSGAVKVVDFGIAKAAAISQTKSHSLRGKWGYLAPEQLRRKTLDRRVDIYALGVVLYELVTGQRHYDAASELEMMRAVLNERFVPASRRRPEVPPELDEIFERCLGQRDERYPTCHELQADLESFMRAQSGGAMTAAQLARVISDLDALPKGLSGYHPAVEVAAPEGTRPTRPSPSIDPDAPLPSDRTPQVSVPLPNTLALDGKGELVHAPHSTDVTVPEPALSEADVGTLRTAAGGRRTRTDRVLSVVIGVLAALAAGLGTAAYWKRQQRASAPARPPPIVAPRPAPAPPPEPPAAVNPPPAEPPPPKPVLATFRVETEPAGDVRINGVFIGRSPVDIERPPGEVRIQASDWKMGFRKEERFEVTEGKNGTLRVVVRRAPVELRIKPYADVELDGRALGRTDVARLELFEGLHTVHLVHRGLHKDLTLDVMVKPEEKNVFRFNMYR